MGFDWDTKKYEATSNLQADAGLELLGRIPLREDAVVLDAGCGMGNLMLDIARRTPDGHVKGIDSSEEMIEKCLRMKLERGIKNADFHMMDLQDIAYEGRFDAVFCNSVLHWVKNAGTVLRAFHRALKPGGIAAIQFPLLNASHPLVFYADKAILASGLSGALAAWEFPWYVPDAEEFRALMQYAGFINIRIELRQTGFAFVSPKEAYGFFEAIGLGLYLKGLPQDKAERLQGEVLKAIRDDCGDGPAKMKFERIFATANRSRITDVI
jgi:trans-aconitate 2-methyltransferase